MAEAPNYYSTYHQLSASSSWTATFFPTDLLAFGFAASRVRINNSCDQRLFYAFGAQAPSTVGDFIAGCGTLLLEGTILGGLTLMTTASSCTARPLVGVSAWESA